MADMIFKTNLLPNSDLEYSLGSTTAQWNIYGALEGTANNAIHAGSATYATTAGHATDSTKVAKAGDTMTGQLYINCNPDVGLNEAGALVVGPKTGTNIGIDGNEIMARNNSAASTLNLNLEGGQIVTGSGGISSSGDIQSSAGYLKSTKNGNTVTIGSQNTTYCHITNSANMPFYFNKSVQINGQYQQYTDAVDSKSWINGRDSAAVRVARFNNYHAGLSMKTTNGSWEIGVYTSNNLWFTYASDANYNANTNTVAQFHASSDGKIWGAVWNDYAEMRDVPEAQSDIPLIKPGMCVYEIGDDRMAMTTERFTRGCKIVSDTFGFNIGETENCKTPIAVSGRVLAYCYEGREEAKKHIGWPVCSGPNGTVSIMSEEEEIKYPSRIIGTISSVPDYEEWGTEKVKVDGRIWIYVK